MQPTTGTPHGTGSRVRRAAHPRRLPQGPLRGRSGADILPGGLIHAPVLRDAAFSLPLGKVTPDDIYPVDPECLRQTERLLQANPSLAGREKVEDIRIRSLEDLGEIVSKRDAPEWNRYELGVLYDEDTKGLTVSVKETLLEYDMNFIPAGLTKDLPEPAGDLFLRVIMDVMKRFGFKTIVETGEYDYLMLSEEEQRQNNADETEEELDFDYYPLEGYHEGEQHYNLIIGLKSLAPATAEETSAFVPRTKKEGLLKELIDEGFALSTLDGTHDLNPYKRCQPGTDPDYNYVSTLDETVVVHWLPDDFFNYYREDLDGQYAYVDGSEHLCREFTLGDAAKEKETLWIHDLVEWIYKTTWLLINWTYLPDDQDVYNHHEE